MCNLQKLKILSEKFATGWLTTSDTLRQIVRGSPVTFSKTFANWLPHEHKEVTFHASQYLTLKNINHKFYYVQGHYLHVYHHNITVLVAYYYCGQ
jgi:hypothetical protein